MFDITEGANMLTKRSSIWLTVTALLIHCSAIKSRVMSWQFMAFKSSAIKNKTCLIRSKHLKWPACRFRTSSGRVLFPLR